MLGRILDAIVKRLSPTVAAAVEQEYVRRQDAGRREVRELVGEMEDVLEKFSRVVARQAKRRTRAMQDALDDDGPPVPAPVAALPEDDLRVRKELLRRRVAAGGLRVSREPRGDS